MEQEGPDVLLTVGLVARRSGLTVKALRHYDRIGLLRPARVDGATGYRLYRGDQVPEARLVGLLRSLDLPLNQVRMAVMAWKNGDGSATDERLLAAQLFNETWRLMEQEGRSIRDDDRILHAAHASRYHWGQVPAATPAHLARGEWQISRVYTVLGRAEPALHHARRVLDLCQENGIGDWDLAFAYEALARACAIAGDAGQAREYTDQALAAAEDIAEDAERELLLADLETIPGQPRYW